MANEPSPTAPVRSPAPAVAEARFVNAMRLNGRQWLAVAVVVTAILWGTPPVWKRLERFETGPDYRIPYPLSKDYWLYERRLERLNRSNVAVLGDSVVWGEYVRTNGTLSHFLNEQSRQPGRFVNAGVNGLFPLALEGLVRYGGGSLRHGKVLLHDNVLWLSNPKADLQTEKEERFNHADLVPQFSPRIPCYKADLNHRLSTVVQRHFDFSQWVNHLQAAYFGQKNILAWTLEEEGGDPPRFPNAYKNPFAQITMSVPLEPAVDPERGPTSPRHKPWSATGEGSTRFEWVELEHSLQWAAFRRLVKLLQSHGNQLLVVIGPFNEQMMAEENRPAFRRLRDGMAAWFAQNQVDCVVPVALPSSAYADASHPLTEGYELLASRLYSDPVFRRWLDRP